jgi:hypothetical protein
VRTWQSGEPDRHVRTNSINAWDTCLHPNIGTQCREPRARRDPAIRLSPRVGLK